MVNPHAGEGNVPESNGFRRMSGGAQNAASPQCKPVWLPQHVVPHGHNRETCFFAEEDYRFYLGHSLRLCVENSLSYSVFLWFCMSGFKHHENSPKAPLGYQSD